MRRRTTAAALAAAAVLVAGCSSSSQATPAVKTTRSTSTTSTAPVADGVVRVRVSSAMRLPVGVSRTVVVAEQHQLVVLGGLASGDVTTARVWLVDPARRSARAAGSLRQRAHDASGALLDGAAVVFGGGAATGLSAVQAWTVTGTRIVGALPTARSDSACAVVAGTAYVVGGFDGRALTRDVLATRDGHRFRVVGRLPIGVRYPAVAAIGTDIYVVGGALATTEGTAAGAQTAAVQRIDTATGRVAVVGRLSRPLAHATAFALDGRLLVVGGRHGAAATSAVSEIDVRTGHDSRVGSLPVALSDAGVAVTGGTAWVVGGETTGPSAPVATVYALRVAS